MVFNRHNTKASKLNGEQVLEMRRLRHFEGWTQQRLAQRYGVTLTTVRNIVHGVTWQYLPNVRPEAPQPLTSGPAAFSPPELTPEAIAASAARVMASMNEASVRDRPDPELLAKYGIKPR